ncbi:spore germination protein B3 [Shouchella clausii]|nr:spore germination protein B3 [Shouchella clausii]
MKFKIIVLLCSVLLLTGCWDHTNIEDYSLVMGIGLGIDAEEKEKVGMLTQLYMPVADDQGVAELSFRNLYTKGATVLDATRELELIDQGILSDHQLVLVFHQDALKKWRAEELINQKIRDERARRGIRVFVTEVPLQTLFKYPTEAKVAPTSQMLDALAQNIDRSTKVLPPVTLGTLSDNINRGYTIILPKVTIKDGNLELDGGQILKKGVHLANALSPDQITSLNWFTGDIKAGVVQTEIDGYRVVYEVLSAELNSVKTTIEDGKLVMDIDVQSDGRLAENWDPQENTYDPNYLKKLEGLFEKTVETQVDQFVNDMQTKYEAAPFKLVKYVRVQQYPFWKKNKDNWDEVFSEATVRYHVDLTITDFGIRGKRQ